MKFALLIAAVAAIKVSDVSKGPDTKNDWDHHYTRKLDEAHKIITDRSEAEIEWREGSQKHMENLNKWRGEFDAAKHYGVWSRCGVSSPKPKYDLNILTLFKINILTNLT